MPRPPLISSAAVAQAVAAAHREEWSTVLATVVRVTRDFDLAEECVQDAYLTALRVWEQHGVPSRPGAWLTTTAKNRALDLLRHESVKKRALPLLIVDAEQFGQQGEEPHLIDDDRLRMIFTCCHPALALEAQAALTLRLLCGVTTAEIARSFLVNESTLAARLTRAKKKIAAAHIPYRVPSSSELAERTTAVLEVINLLFAIGHTAPHGPMLVRDDLVKRALDLGRMLHKLLPRNPEVEGLLAMMLLTIARDAERAWPSGELKLLVDHDRSQWDQQRILEGTELVTSALTTTAALGIRPGKYLLLAAINALHDEAPSAELTDWPQIVGIYDVLLRVWPTAVVQLNRAVAVSFAQGPQAALDAIDAIDDSDRLASYPYFHAARAACLAQLGRHHEAVLAYDQAVRFSENAIEQQFLVARRTRSAQLAQEHS